MNLCIDQGNSSTKAGIFDKNKLIQCFSYQNFNIEILLSIFSDFPIENCIFSTVAEKNPILINFLKEKIPFVIVLDDKTPIPIINKYLTPESLGNDRLAGVVAASFLKPNLDILVVDAGTAITYDFIDASKTYWGGNISPGIDLRIKSLHEFTQKLPLVEPTPNIPILGVDTYTAIVAGVIQGIVFEIDGYIDFLQLQYPKLLTFLTGGSIFYFDKKLKNTIFVEKYLVLIGLNHILQYNVKP